MPELEIALAEARGQVYLELPDTDPRKVRGMQEDKDTARAALNGIRDLALDQLAEALGKDPDAIREMYNASNATDSFINSIIDTAGLSEEDKKKLNK